MNNRNRKRGFTLVELLIALVVAAILVSIALPSYRSFVLRSQRAVGKAFLIDLVKRQEEWSLKSRAYATSFGPLLDVESSEVTIDRKGVPVAAGSGDAIYRISFAASPAPSASAFVFVASAVGRQLRDTECLTFAVNANGIRTANGSVSEPAIRQCWER